MVEGWKVADDVFVVTFLDTKAYDVDGSIVYACLHIQMFIYLF
jgi:hypothetical protein